MPAGQPPGTAGLALLRGALEEAPPKADVGPKPINSRVELLLGLADWLAGGEDIDKGTDLIRRALAQRAPDGPEDDEARDHHAAAVQVVMPAAWSSLHRYI